MEATREDIEEFAGMYAHRMGISPRSRRVIVAAVRGFYRWLARAGHISTDISRDLPYPDAGVRFPGALSLQFAEKMLMVPDINTFTGIRDCAMLSVLLGAGLRVSELVGLNEGDLFFEKIDGREQLTLRVRGKGKRERLIPAPRDCWALLRAYLGHDMLEKMDRTLPSGEVVLFVSIRNHRVPPHGYFGEHRRLTRGAVFRFFRRYAEKAGAPKEQRHPHAARHLFATELLEGGTDLVEIQASLGHASIESTRIYLHLAMRKRRESIAKTGPLAKIRTPVTDLLKSLDARSD